MKLTQVYGNILARNWRRIRQNGFVPRRKNLGIYCLTLTDVTCPVYGMLETVERQNKALHDEYLKTVIDYKNDWEQELARRKRLGIILPDPLPQPDHISVDIRTGQVRSLGPWTKEEKVKWDNLRERKKECDRAIASYEEDLRRNPRSRNRKYILEEIAFERDIRLTISEAIPD